MERIQSVDVFRVFAIIAVVALHTAVYSGPNAVGRELDTATLLNNAYRFAVPLFFVLSGYFWASRCATGAELLRRSVVMSKRVLLIFLAWAVIYLIAPVGEAFHAYGYLGSIKAFYWTLSSPNGMLDALLVGPKVHLWFLPALISIVLISGVFVARQMDRSLLALAIALYLIGLAGGAYANTPLGLQSGFNFRNGPFFGLIFFVTGYWLQKRGQHIVSLPLGLLLAVTGLVLHVLEVKWLHGAWGTSMWQDFVVGTYPFGVGVALMALSNARGLQMPRLATIGQLVLGIYASHYLFVDLLRPVDDVHHGMLAWDVAYVAVVFALALGTTYGLSRFAWTRRFVT